MCVTVNVSGVYNINFSIRWFVFFFFFFRCQNSKGCIERSLVNPALLIATLLLY